MSNKKLEINVPVICTRGVIVFPKYDIMIEVGRKKSMNAVDEAQSFYNGHVWLVAQKNILVDDPTTSDLYTVGTLCQIKRVRQKDGFMRVTFTGLQRAQLIEVEDDSRFMLASVLPLQDIHKDSLEEKALMRRLSKEIEALANQSPNYPADVFQQMAQGFDASLLCDQFANS